MPSVPELRKSAGSEGQALVLLALAMVAVLAMAALIIDGGNAFAQQRVTQNGVDASAEAGAVALAENLIAKGGGAPSLPNSDQDVLDAVVTAASNNDISETPTAFYTDIDGDPLSPAAQVGAGGSSDPPSNAYGVAVTAGRTFSTYLGGIFALLPGTDGQFELTANANATAIAGQVNSICPSDAPCGFLPVTFPTSLTLCDGTNSQVDFGTAWPYQNAPALTPEYEVIIPLCTTGPGSVGWLDIEPHDDDCNGGGSTLLACDITTPGNTSLGLPIWIHAVTGNTNAELVQDALDTFIGKQVQIPFYECIGRGIGQVGPNPTCEEAAAGGVGSTLYYRIVAVANFVLHKAYIQATNPECNAPPGQPFVGGNGSTGCLKGWFVNALNPGPVGPPSGSYPWAAYGVQLIR